MQLIYLSNYFNHHQKPLSDAFYDKLEGKYFFIETTNIPEERKKLGYKELDAPYVIKYFTNKQYVDSLIMKADVVIIGEAPVHMVKNRLKRGLMTFHDNERRYKSIIKYLKWPIYTMKSLILNNGYLLCASAFASRDFRLSGMTPSKCYKWGYFTEVKDLNITSILENKESMLCSAKKISLLWVARFISWKHPELVVDLALRLRDSGYGFHINMIGTGLMYEKIQNMINSLNLGNYITLLGSMSPAEVRKHMEASDIFLATSDQNEGWGATINESMSSGCAVVASHTIGAVPFLIRHRFNGLIYESNNSADLFNKVKWLMDNGNRRKEISTEAYMTMKKLWHPDRACESFINLVNALRRGENNPIQNGPCSAAPIYQNKWFNNTEELA